MISCMLSCMLSWMLCFRITWCPSSPRSSRSAGSLSSPVCSPECSSECSSESRDVALEFLEFDALIAPCLCSPWLGSPWLGSPWLCSLESHSIALAPWACSLPMLSSTTQYRSFPDLNHDCRRTWSNSSSFATLLSKCSLFPCCLIFFLLLLRNVQCLHSNPSIIGIWACGALPLAGNRIVELS